MQFAHRDVPNNRMRNVTLAISITYHSHSSHYGIFLRGTTKIARLVHGIVQRGQSRLIPYAIKHLRLSGISGDDEGDEDEDGSDEAGGISETEDSDATEDYGEAKDGEDVVALLRHGALLEAVRVQHI